MKINFIKISNITLPISILLCMISLLLIIKSEINWGIEFTGGTEIEIRFKDKVEIETIKKKFKNLSNAKIKYFGSNKSIQLKIKNDKSKIEDKIEKIKYIIYNENPIYENAEIIKVDSLGEEMNRETINNCLIAALIAIIAMMMYLTYRFEYIFAISAILALIHDVIITSGVIVFTDIEFDLTILAALFTVFGYSINDTIVVFDRIREYSKKNDTINNIDIINKSINRTLSRTLITSISTLFVTIVLAIFGGKSLFGFSLVISLGIIIGTYSSIFIAAIIIFKLKKKSSKFNNYFNI